MINKRITILSGHYGSGKTNIAVNLAISLKEEYKKVYLADLDIVNPYYRSLDSRAELERKGIGVIGSGFANSNLDVPALPKEMYAVTADQTARFVLDVGGDDRGALALGRLSDDILSEDNFSMLAVVNCYRPLTRTPQATAEILREIEFACKIPFTAIINNSNLGKETTPGSVLDSVGYADEISKITQIPVVFTAVNETLYSMLNGKIKNLFALKLQEKTV